MFVLLLVLCAIKGAQHSNQHSGMLVAARVLPARAAAVMTDVRDLCVRGSRNRFTWRPGQQACAGRVVGHTIVFCRENMIVIC